MYETYVEEIKKLGGWKFIEKIPPDFWSEKKLQNFVLALQEEKKGVLKVQSMPYHLVIEPTSVCNLRCALCSTGLGNKSRNRGTMQLDQFKKLIDESGDYMLDLYLQNWGEPTLVRWLPEMIRYAADRGIWMYLSTNFSLPHTDEYLGRLMNSGLALLHCDLDGTTQEVYVQYRVGGKLDLVLANIRKCVAFKKQNGLKYPLIEGTMIVMRQNEHQIEDFNKLSEELGLDQWNLSKVQLDPNMDKGKWLPQAEAYRYKTYADSDPYAVQPCHWPWSGLVINYDGNISPCCIIDDKKADFANVFTEGIRQVWNSPKYISARAEFWDQGKITAPNICNLCKNQTHKPELKRFKNTYSLMLDEQMLKEKYPQFA